MLDQSELERLVDASRRTGLNYTLIWRYTTSGAIRSVRRGVCLYVERASVDRWVAERERQAAVAQRRKMATA